LECGTRSLGRGLEEARALEHASETGCRGGGRGEARAKCAWGSCGSGASSESWKLDMLTAYTAEG